ncbi:MAG: SMC-Scp complex subunit ScpB [Chthoniobacterales bacterium]
MKQILESILFCSNKPLPIKAIQAVFKSTAEAAKEEDTAPAEFAKVKEPQLIETLEALQKEYAESERGITLMENAGGWQLVTHPECGPWARQLFPELKPARLSGPALETLAIIAYRQPITRADLEAVRGVAVDGVMQTLLDRGLVKISGRAEVPGRPLLYETTQFFMEHFNLRNLDELPDAHELRTIPLPKAPVVGENGEVVATEEPHQPHLLEGEDATPPETSEEAATEREHHAHEEPAAAEAEATEPVEETPEASELSESEELPDDSPEAPEEVAEEEETSKKTDE